MSTSPASVSSSFVSLSLRRELFLFGLLPFDPLRSPSTAEFIAFSHRLSSLICSSAPLSSPSASSALSRLSRLKYSVWLSESSLRFGLSASLARLLFERFLQFHSALRSAADASLAASPLGPSTILSVDLSEFMIYLYLHRFAGRRIEAIKLTDQDYQSLVSLALSPEKQAAIKDSEAESAPFHFNLLKPEFDRLGIAFIIRDAAASAPAWSEKLSEFAPFWKSTKIRHSAVPGTEIIEWIKAASRNAVSVEDHSQPLKRVTGRDRAFLINSNEFGDLVIQDSERVTVYAPTALRFVLIENVHDSFISLGASNFILLVRKCHRLTLSAPARAVEFLDVEDSTAFLFTLNRPIVICSDSSPAASPLTLAPYNTYYPSLESDCRSIGLPITDSAFSRPVVIELPPTDAKRRSSHSGHAKSPRVALLPPDRFFPSSFPFDTPPSASSAAFTSSNPFPLPSSYSAHLESRVSLAASCRSLIDDSALSGSDRDRISSDIQSLFESWLKQPEQQDKLEHFNRLQSKQ